ATMEKTTVNLLSIILASESSALAYIASTILVNDFLKQTWGCLSNQYNYYFFRGNNSRSCLPMIDATPPARYTHLVIVDGYACAETHSNSHCCVFACGSLGRRYAHSRHKPGRFGGHGFRGLGPIRRGFHRCPGS